MIVLKDLGPGMVSPAINNNIVAKCIKGNLSKDISNLMPNSCGLYDHSGCLQLK